ncbi:hypothetical protein [Streptomyces sp. NPDC058457]|uniref:hypothetical protein n=1 Tax=Streptomyces sp. NPDC058457 TaxID=3346507 RepID=UPI003649F2BC
MTVRTRAALALVAAVTLAATGATAAAAPAAAPRTEPISVTPSGKAGNGPATGAVISRDGRYAAFASTATDLLPGAPHGGVLVRDLRTGKLTHAADGTDPSLSADGRYLAYTTASQGLRLLDRRTGRTERLDTGLPAGFGPGSHAYLSGTARYIVFTATGDADGPVVFLRDRDKHTTERISRPRPTWEPRSAAAPTVSDDGRRIVYQYTYSNGPRGDDWSDIRLYDRSTGRYTQIDRSTDGSPTTRESLNPALSADGRTVVFESADTHLVPGDTDNSWNVFVHHIATGVNDRIQGYGRDAAVSADGRLVTLTTHEGAAYPVYVRDLRTGTRTLVAPEGHVAPGAVTTGRVAFTSYDGTLNPRGDGNGEQDAFVRHLR